MVIEENKSWACLEAIMGDYPDVTTMEFEIELHLPPAAKAISSKKLDCLLVKKMRDSESEVIFSKLSPEHRALFTGAKTKEVNSFLQNQAVRKSLNDAETTVAFSSGPILTVARQDGLNQRGGQESHGAHRAPGL